MEPPLRRQRRPRRGRPGARERRLAVPQRDARDHRQRRGERGQLVEQRREPELAGVAADGQRQHRLLDDRRATVAAPRHQLLEILAPADRRQLLGARQRGGHARRRLRHPVEPQDARQVLAGLGVGVRGAIQDLRPDHGQRDRAALDERDQDPRRRGAVRAVDPLGRVQRQLGRAVARERRGVAVAEQHDHLGDPAPHEVRRERARHVARQLDRAERGERAAGAVDPAREREVVRLPPEQPRVRERRQLGVRDPGARPPVERVQELARSRAERRAEPIELRRDLRIRIVAADQRHARRDALAPAAPGQRRGEPGDRRRDRRGQRALEVLVRARRDLIDLGGRQRRRARTGLGVDGAGAATREARSTQSRMAGSARPVNALASASSRLRGSGCGPSTAATRARGRGVVQLARGRGQRDERGGARQLARERRLAVAAREQRGEGARQGRAIEPVRDELRHRLDGRRGRIQLGARREREERGRAARRPELLDERLEPLAREHRERAPRQLHVAPRARLFFCSICASQISSSGGVSAGSAHSSSQPRSPARSSSTIASAPRTLASVLSRCDGRSPASAARARGLPRERAREQPLDVRLREPHRPLQLEQPRGRRAGVRRIEARQLEHRAARARSRSRSAAATPRPGARSTPSARPPRGARAAAPAGDRLDDLRPRGGDHLPARGRRRIWSAFGRPGPARAATAATTAAACARGRGAPLPALVTAVAPLAARTTAAAACGRAPLAALAPLAVLAAALAARCRPAGASALKVAVAPVRVVGLGDRVERGERLIDRIAPRRRQPPARRVHLLEVRVDHVGRAAPLRLEERPQRRPRHARDRVQEVQIRERARRVQIERQRQRLARPRRLRRGLGARRIAAQVRHQAPPPPAAPPPAPRAAPPRRWNSACA